MGFQVYEKNGALDTLMAADEQGRTPLHLAAYNGHEQIIRALVACEGEGDRWSVPKRKRAHGRIR